MAAVIKKVEVFRPRLARVEKATYRVDFDVSVARYSLHKDGTLVVSSVCLSDCVNAAGVELRDEAVVLNEEQKAAEKAATEKAIQVADGAALAEAPLTA